MASSDGTEYSETIADLEESPTAGSSKQSRKGRQRKHPQENSESLVSTYVHVLEEIAIADHHVFVFSMLYSSGGGGNASKEREAWKGALCEPKPILAEGEVIYRK